MPWAIAIPPLVALDQVLVEDLPMPLLLPFTDPAAVAEEQTLEEDQDTLMVLEWDRAAMHQDHKLDQPIPE